jgi:ABC-type amino acid transport substrate-binding protein
MIHDEAPKSVARFDLASRAPQIAAIGARRRMITPSRLLLFAAVAAVLLASCATTRRLSAAGDVHSLLVAIRDDDHAAFDVHVDRPALEAQLQSHLVDRAAAANVPRTWKGLGVLLSGPMAKIAGDALIQPEVFRAVADYYGYRPQTPIPSALALAGALRSLPDGRVCAARDKKGPCLLTFADEKGVWRLVGFDGDAAMLKLRIR